MTRVVRVDEVTYADLVSITGKMMTAFEKPWSLGMTVRMAVGLLELVMNTPLGKELVKRVKERDIPTPEEFMERLENQYKEMIQSGESAST